LLISWFVAGVLAFKILTTKGDFTEFDEGAFRSMCLAGFFARRLERASGIVDKKLKEMQLIDAKPEGEVLVCPPNWPSGTR
jgi:hypothetical protein